MDSNLWDGVGRVGCEATEEQNDAWGPHITFDEALKYMLYIKLLYYILPWASVIGSRV